MWRSLVAHLTGGQGVAGSNPVIPTRKSRELKGFRDFVVSGVSASLEGERRGIGLVLCNGWGAFVGRARESLVDISALDNGGWLQDKVLRVVYAV